MTDNKKSVRVPNYIRNLVFIAERLSLSWATKLVLYFFFKPVKFPTPEYEKPAFESAELIRIAGPAEKTIQLYRWGNGPKVLLTHGWSGRGTQMGLLALALAKAGFEVISFDGPAHGRSTGKKTDLLEFVGAIRAVKAQYPDIKYYIGHSMGGLASVHAAVGDPTVEKLVLIGTPNTIGEIIDNFCRMVRASPNVAQRIKIHIEQTFHYRLEEYDSESAIRQLTDRRGFILHDKGDYDVPVHNAVEMHKAWGAQATLSITEGLGHRRILRDPDALIRVVKFVKE